MKSKYLLFLIIFSQFAGTSLWFAGNAVLADLIPEMGLKFEDLGLVTSSVQTGFILGTLVFAFAALADRYSPSKIFFACSILGSVFNVMIFILPPSLLSVLISRFLTGIMLAGIYPVGMKIAADWFKNELGKAIGYLVGALVLGTAFPNLIKALGHGLDWKFVLGFVSILAFIGGTLVLIFIKDGPYRQKGAIFDPLAIKSMFKAGSFRSSVFGYFGHMWELYAFWAFVPLMLTRFNQFQGMMLNIYLWTFLIIAAGSVGCVIGGLWSIKAGSARVAWVNLLSSGICILLFPVMIELPLPVFLIYMLIWGWTVVGDSAQFSAMAAAAAPKGLVGSGLTIMNCIGFSLTIISISALSFLSSRINIEYAILVLLIGPVFGLASIYTMRK